MTNDKTYTCLIPYYRLNTVQKAITSALDDGWYVESMMDSKQDGVHKIREALLNRAFVSPETKFVRYLDDDDVLLPHKAKIKDIFNTNPNIDIVYTDYILKTPLGFTHHPKQSGDIIKDCMTIHPWSWVARIEVLHKIKDIYGFVWDYNRPCREGGYTWLKFLSLHFSMLYVPIEAYQYNKSSDPSCISNHPEFATETIKLEQELKHLS